MQEINWNNFKAKFNGKEQSSFEWLCYLLFCKEFNKNIGIFRYKNQSGIETNPISKNKDVIGWQAKFYETTLSQNKKDLIEMIAKSKRDYPDITKIIFYTNTEWGQGKKQNDSQIKIEVEKIAEDLKIQLEWRNASYFESPFLTLDNEIIAKHFFSLGESIVDLLKEKQNHAESILYGIQTEIAFEKSKIEIDRSEVLKNIRETIDQNQILILSGVAGVGKTAIVKKLYNEINSEIPFYIFKANEFNVNNINELFKSSNLYNFIEAHQDEKNKIVIIDSAEKLLELNNSVPFKECLANFIKTKWKIIFTTRNNYLEDLNYQFVEIYQIKPFNLDVINMDSEALTELSQKYKFIIPADPKLFELIKNPFYLNEYLKFYKKDEQIDYLKFKEKLWNKIIKKSKSSREQCFMQMVFQRANEGQFYIVPKCDSQILDELEQDGIIGSEKAGYFITHDIYEEWGLENIIEAEYIKKKSNKEFFQKIGESLPIRRSFRNWLSEKLLLKDESIKKFIEENIEKEEIAQFWQDEILISILLSDYAEVFFELFAEKLLENEQKLLKRISFLIRIACKEVDEDFFKQLGIKKLNIFSMKYILTKPKGQGWQSLIKYIYKNLDQIGIKNINFILPLIHDWNSKIKEGEITRLSSLIALKYYQGVIKESSYFFHDDTKEKLLQTILFGSAEIKNELKAILEEILKNKWKYHRDPYYNLSKTILTKLEGIIAAKVLPGYVLQLADLFWSCTLSNDDMYHHSGIGVEKYYGIEENHLEYFPASAFQTPIYWLLQSSLTETLDFILEFTNRTVEHFAKSDFAKHEVEEIDVCINNEETIKQYICDRLWCTYRGSQVAPYLLESMHMALEKKFLEMGKYLESKILESWLLYLLKNSKSASISGLVASIVLAYPEKTFNVAKVLFRTKAFFLYDAHRLVLDQSVLCPVGADSNGLFFQNERIESGNLEHRKESLEQLCFKYQVIKTENTSEEEERKRQKELWDILDGYYEKLPNSSEENESDKTWRLFLARMDYRKMTPKVESSKEGKGTVITFNPEIDRELKKFSEEALKKSSNAMKYTPLKLWSHYRFENNEDEYKKYKQYEYNVEEVIAETKAIVEILKNRSNEDISFFNQSVPAYTCTVLIRDYYDKLSEEDREYCKQVIVEFASVPLKKGYSYQISDGTQPAIGILAALIEYFPKDKDKIKTLHFSLLIKSWGDIQTFVIGSVLYNLWDISFEDAHAIFLGYLLLKPKYDELSTEIRKENYKKKIYENSETQVFERFYDQYKTELETIISNSISYEELGNISLLDLEILKISFELLPMETENIDHKNFLNIIIPIFAKKLFIDDEKIDYMLKHRFLEKYAYLILNSTEKEIGIYLKPFIYNFDGSRDSAAFFQAFISAEDKLNRYEEFWIVWNAFYKKIVELCKNGSASHYSAEIVHNYLLAWPYWREDIKEWHSLKDRDKAFLKKIAEDIGQHPSVLYSLSKILNGIGSKFLEEGIEWISNILQRDRTLISKELEINTIYYIENIIRRYVYKNRTKIKKTVQIKKEVIEILNFLFERGSVTGYLLREDIL